MNNGFREIAKDFPEIGEIRGEGLMQGVELVEDPVTKAPLNPAKFADIFESLKEYGCLFSKAGRFGNIFRLQPSMVLTAQDIDFALDCFEQSLKDNLRK